MPKSRTKSDEPSLLSKTKHADEQTSTIDEIVSKKVLYVVEKAVSHLGDNVIVKHLWYDRYRINIRDNAGKVVCSYFVRANLDGLKTELGNV